MKFFIGYDLSPEQKKIVLLSSLGGLLEFYDFTVYGLFAVYFAHQFFPSHNEFIALMASYSVFVVGYIVRPIGGILFSHIGDEIGRKTVLILTMILMGVASLGMGLLPTYAQIGVAAPLLMLLLRLIQGLAIGGELPSMIVYVAETMPRKRGYGLGGVFSGTVAGLIPGMLINLLIVHYFSTEQILSYGWRIPFVLGGLLCIIAYFVRKELHETIAFKKIKQHKSAPFFEVLHHHLGKVFIGAGLVSIMAMPIILLIIFMPTYLTKFAGIEPKVASDAILVSSVISVIAIYFMGILANKFNPIKLMRISLVLIVIFAGLCYTLISHKVDLILALSLFAVFQGGLVTLPAIIISYIFPTNIRLTGVALSYNLSFVLFGGLTPIVMTSLIVETGLTYIIPVLLLLISVIYAWWSLEKAKAFLKK